MNLNVLQRSANTPACPFNSAIAMNNHAAAHRAQRLRSALDNAHTASVTDAIYSAGYQSSSRFYEQSAQVLGMTPSRYRAGGAAQDIRFAIGQCSLGAILVAQSDRGICAILLGDDADTLARDLQDRFAHAHLIGGDAAFEALLAQVVAFVEAPGLGLILPLDARARLHGRRIRADRAAPAHAFAGRGGAAFARRRRGVCRAPPPRAGHARAVPGADATWRKLLAQRAAVYAGDHFS